MKNVLFTTTALVALGGAAFAQSNPNLSISGSAELGITYTDLDGAPNDGFDFVGDYGLDATFSGTSDAGISFGANIEIEHNGSTAGGGGELDDFNVFVSGAFGTLTLGDVDSAYDKVSVGIETGGLADEADYYATDSGLDGVSDGIIMRYDYTFSGVTLSVSLEQGRTIADDPDTIAVETSDVDNVLAAGIGYSGAFSGVDVELGVGYTETEVAVSPTLAVGDHSIIGVSGRAGFGSIGVNAFFEDVEQGTGTDFQRIQASVDYTAGPILVGVNGVFRTGDIEDESFGIFGEYDLGGGLSMVGALSTSNRTGDDELRAGFGFAMSF